jgi:DNA-directed RNA polymerase alpha subunit
LGERAEMSPAELVRFWRNKGLSTRASHALVHLNCETEANVRALRDYDILGIPGIGRGTLEEINLILFGEEAAPPRVSYLKDKTLIAELEARGYEVRKIDVK